MISTIIAAYNEENNIGHCLESILAQNGDFEIIVVDGGSSDKTVAIAQCSQATVLQSHKKNIGHQNNLGVRAAQGEILLFLHADSLLPQNAFWTITDFYKKNMHAAGGSFSMVLDGRRFFYKVLAAGGNLFCWITKIFFGDRGIFVKKEVFENLSGFNTIPIMEDVDFSIRMKKTGKTKMLKGPVISSSRKFEKEPFWKTIYLILWSLYAYFRKLEPAEIRRKYYTHQK